MEKVCFNGLMVPPTKACLWTTNCRVKADIDGHKKVVSMLENGQRTKCMGREYLPKLMVGFIKAISSKARKMELETSCGLTSVSTEATI